MSGFTPSPRCAGTVGDLDGTSPSVTRKPESRRVAVDENWLSYHHPDQLGSLWGMILTTEEIARERGAVACTSCYGGPKLEYDFDYIDEDGVLG